METTEEQTIVPCPNCRRMVPIANMELHQIYSCVGVARRQRKRHPRNTSSRSTMMEEDESGGDDNDSCGGSCGSSSTVDLLGSPRPKSRARLSADATSVTAPISLLSPDTFVDTSPEVMTRNTSTSSHSVSPLVQCLGEVVNLADNDDYNNVNDVDTSANGSSGKPKEGDDEAVAVNWSCPRCTLVNSLDNSRCEACHYHNRTVTDNDSTIVRDPDPVRRERLVDLAADNDSPSLIFNRISESFEPPPRYNGTETITMNDTTSNDAENTATLSAHTSTANSSDLRRRRIIIIDQPTPTTTTTTTSQDNDDDDTTPSFSSHMRTVGNSALIGSALGAAAAYVRDNSIASGALEGAVAGAMGGALYSTISPGGNNNGYTGRRQRRSSRSRRSSFPPPSTPDGIRPHSSAHIMRGRRRDDPFVQMRLSAGWGTGADNSADDAFANVLYRMIQSQQHERNATNNNDAQDPMSYDLLLAMFGDGSENQTRGLETRQIESLPTSTIVDVEKEIPLDHRKCSICLENFCAGSVRKVLPCLHGFCKDCVDEWLKINGCCPVCKHDVFS